MENTHKKSSVEPSPVSLRLRDPSLASLAQSSPSSRSCHRGRPGCHRSPAATGMRPGVKGVQGPQTPFGVAGRGRGMAGLHPPPHTPQNAATWAELAQQLGAERGSVWGISEWIIADKALILPLKQLCIRATRVGGGRGTPPRLVCPPATLQAARAQPSPLPALTSTSCHFIKAGIKSNLHPFGSGGARREAGRGWPWEGGPGGHGGAGGAPEEGRWCRAPYCRHI